MIIDDEEPVILVVGNETEIKTRVADALAQDRGASELDITGAGVRTFTRKWSTCAAPPVVVDTVPLLSYSDSDGMDSVQAARQWISQNSLKWIFGKSVIVVCVVSAPGKNDVIHRNAHIYSFSWLHLLRLVFKEHRRAITMLVNSEGTRDDARIEDVLERLGFGTSNAIFANLRGGDLLPVVKSAVGLSVRPGKKKDRNVKPVPFLLKGVLPNAGDIEMTGPWGPERMILFGRTGSGKSTLAQMLTTGKLDPDSKTFASSSGIRGKTKKLKEGQGRGWYVVDSPGFGEPDDKLSTVSTAKAEEKIKKYVKLIDGHYSHYIYVVMKDRIDELEVNIWKFFMMLFGDADYIRSHFTVVVSNADQTWMDNNIKDLQKRFEGCNSFLSAEFPPTQADEEWEEESQEVRMESLKQLEDGLASLARCDIACSFGDVSSMYSRRRVAAASIVIRHGSATLLDKAEHFAEAGTTNVIIQWSLLVKLLTYDFKKVCLPK